jgi:hypothetical protein
MTDLWYTYGAMVADIGLLNKIGDANPQFKLIGMDVTETVDGEVKPQVRRLAAGFLDSDSTTLVRETIRDYVAKNLPRGAPPISLYTAGKMCQLWNTFKDGMLTSISKAHAAYDKAAGKSAGSTALLTMVGLCLLDRNFVTEILLSQDQSLITAAAKEFDINQQGADWKVLQSLLKDTTFGDAHDLLFKAPCWDGIQACAEVFVFYGNFKRAVN